VSKLRDEVSDKLLLPVWNYLFRFRTYVKNRADQRRDLRPNRLYHRRQRLFDRRQRLYDRRLFGRSQELGDTFTISFANEGLASVPARIRYARDLRKLDLSGNRLVEVPAWLGELGRLEELNLSNNRLTSVPKSLGNLFHLETLDLSGNRLTSVPKSLGNLINLHIFLLGRSHHPISLPVVGLASTESGAWPQERELPALRPVASTVGIEPSEQDGNRLTSIPQSLGNLSALETLDLSGNRLASIPQSLGNLSALETLDLSGNRLTSIPQSLADLRVDGLQLNLSDNRQGEVAVASSETWAGESLDHAWTRLRPLFVPSVSLDAIISAADMSDPGAAVLQLYTWERDRLLTLAKGTAGAAITVLAGLIATATEGKVTTSETVLYLAAALIAILLFWGGFLLIGLRRLAEEYTTVLTLKE
jgi:hypothetical protein